MSKRGIELARKAINKARRGIEAVDQSPYGLGRTIVVWLIAHHIFDCLTYYCECTFEFQRYSPGLERQLERQ